VSFDIGSVDYQCNSVYTYMFVLFDSVCLTGSNKMCDAECRLPYSENTSLCWGSGPDMCQRGK